MWLRHKDAANQYRKTLALSTDESMNKWLNDMIAYREALEKDCREFLETLPPVPFTPNRNIASALSNHWKDLKEALLLENYSKLTSIFKNAEIKDYEALKESLKIKSLPDGIKHFLSDQSRRMLEVQRKVERLDTVPAFK